MLLKSLIVGIVAMIAVFCIFTFLCNVMFPEDEKVHLGNFNFWVILLGTLFLGWLFASAAFISFDIDTREKMPISEYEKIGTYSYTEYLNMNTGVELEGNRTPFPDIQDIHNVKYDVTDGEDYIEVYEYAKGEYYKEHPFYKCLIHKNINEAETECNELPHGRGKFIDAL